jgi:hypothetical protein
MVEGFFMGKGHPAIYGFAKGKKLIVNHDKALQNPPERRLPLAPPEALRGP